MATKIDTAKLQFTRKSDEKGLDADEIVVKRAKALCYERHQDPDDFRNYDRAVVEVLRADRGLAQCYTLRVDAQTLDEVLE